MSQAAPASSSARSAISSTFTSSTPPVQPSRTADRPTWSPSLSPMTPSHSDKGAIIGGTIGGVGGLLLIILFALLFWTRWKRRLFREQQIAIRRMTIIGPPATTPQPSLPYPFLGRGSRLGNFGYTGGSAVGDIETLTSSADSGKQEAGLPRTNPPAPAYEYKKNSTGRDSIKTLVADSSTPDSASVFSTKQSDIGDGDGIVFIDGIYVLALENENECHAGRKGTVTTDRR